MDLQFNRKPLQCLRQVVWEVKNEEQTQEVRLNEGMPDVGRVLGAWGQPVIRSKDWRGSGMSISGGVMCWVLYAPEDGTVPRSVETWIPFQMRWDFPETQHDGVIRVACCVKSVDARAAAPRKLMVRAAMSVMGEALEPGEGELYVPGEMPEDVQLLRRAYPLWLPMEAGEKVFALDEELELPGSAPKMEKLIRYELQPELIDQKVMGDKVVFRGTAIIHILYRCDNDRFHSWDFEVPFSQFAELDREYEAAATARVLPAVTTMELEPDEQGRLRLKAGIIGQYLVCDRAMVELVEDVYSPERVVTPRMGQLEMPVILEERREPLRAEAAAEAEGESVDIAFGTMHPRLTRIPDSVQLEMPGSFQLLYYDGDGNLQGTATRWEGKEEIPSAENTGLTALVCVSGRPQVSMASGKAQMVCDTVIGLCATAKQGIPMVTGLELGEKLEKDPARPSLVLRRSGKDSLWKLAKESGSTVGAIREANHLTEEPESGRVLLIPIP